MSQTPRKANTDSKNSRGALATSDSQCSMNCGGNPAQKCGAGSRMSVYALGDLTVVPVPKSQKTDLPGKWEWKGCLAYDTSRPHRVLDGLTIDSEGTTKKIWKYQSILTKTNSPTECLSRCSRFGFMAGGMEYGSECCEFHGQVLASCSDPRQTVVTWLTFRITAEP